MACVSHDSLSELQKIKNKHTCNENNGPAHEVIVIHSSDYCIAKMNLHLQRCLIEGKIPELLVNPREY